MTSSIFFISF